MRTSASPLSPDPLSWGHPGPLTSSLLAPGATGPGVPCRVPLVYSPWTLPVPPPCPTEGFQGGSREQRKPPVASPPALLSLAHLRPAWSTQCPQHPPLSPCGPAASLRPPSPPWTGRWCGSSAGGRTGRGHWRLRREALWLVPVPAPCLLGLHLPPDVSRAIGLTWAVCVHAPAQHLLGNRIPILSPFIRGGQSHL